jgi:NAD(P)-dependent dehydrogenase (short-subunit alcohol dehydrogenase family)
MDPLTLFRVDGKVAWVVGAGGLGGAIAGGLAASGGTVALTDVNPLTAEELADRLRADGTRALGMGMDIRHKSEVESAADRIARELDRIDILVNVAGTAKRGESVDYPEDLWNTILSVNLTGAFFACQAAGRHMLRQGDGGAIVNITSVHGNVGVATHSAYCSSKAGLANLTRVLALEWAPQRIRVNAIAPAFFRTAMGAGALDPALYPSTIGQVPMNRIGEPEEIVGPVLFLVSDAASFVTGHVLAVDGGYLAR